MFVLPGANVELTDYMRQMTALQWAKHCGSQQCVKALRKHAKKHSKVHQCRYARSTSDLTFESTDIHRHKKSPVLIDRIKRSLGLPTKQEKQSRECLLALSGVMASSTSAIPLLIGVSPEDDNGYADDITAALPMMSLFNPKKTMIKLSPPIILITKDSGEIVEEDSIKNKQSHKKAPHSNRRKNSGNTTQVTPVDISAK